MRKGNTKSCGCLNLEMISKRELIDLTGMRFGKLVVVSRAEDQQHTASRSVMWNCHCDCGNDTIVNGNSLRRGLSTSCGCYRSEWTINKFSIDISGQRFGRLVAIYSDVFPTGKDRTVRKWFCKCDCGATTWVATHSLLSGYTKSCGCLMSLGEELVSNELSSLNVQFSRQYYFRDLVGKNGGYLYFDFALFDHDKLIA